MVNLDPEAESFLRIDLTKAMQGATTGAVDHPLGATGLWAEIVGFGESAVSTHTTAKENGLDQVFPKGVQAAGLLRLISLETDRSGQGENEAIGLEGRIMDLLVDLKAS